MSSVVPAASAELDKELLCALLGSFRLLTVEDVLVAAAHHARCDGWEAAAKLYAQLQRALEWQLQSSEGMQEAVSEEALRLLQLVTDLPCEKSAEWLEIVRANQLDLIALRCPVPSPSPPPAIPAADEPQPEADPSASSAPPSLDDGGQPAAVQVEAKTKVKGSARGRRRTRSVKDVGAASASVPASGPEKKRRKTGMGRLREALRLQQEMAELYFPSTQEVPAAESACPTSSSSAASAHPSLFDESVEGGAMDPQQPQRDVGEVNQALACGASELSLSDAAAMGDGDEQMLVDGEVGTAGAVDGAAPYTVSRWQRPRKRLVRFRVNENRDELRQLQAMEAEYWREQETQATDAGAEAVGDDDVADGAEVVVDVQEEDDAATAAQLLEAHGEGGSSSSSSSGSQ